jgi:hypothetical protein
MTQSVTPDFDKIINNVISRAIDAEIALALAQREIEALILKNDELLAKVMNVQSTFIREEKRLARMRNKLRRERTDGTKAAPKT